MGTHPLVDVTKVAWLIHTPPPLFADCTPPLADRPGHFMKGPSGSFSNWAGRTFGAVGQGGGGAVVFNWTGTIPATKVQ